MRKIRIFISSVQTEFSEERKALYEYLLQDPLLGRFFEPFLFEFLPAMDQRAYKVYLSEVEQCDIYLGLLGQEYGFEDAEGVSPTEREFDQATIHHRTKLVFLTNHSASERHPKEAALVAKAQEVLVRKRFGSVHELKSAVYAALVRFLEEKEIIRTVPFDATINPKAGLDDLDTQKIKLFVHTARKKRGFPLSEESEIHTVLTHLNLTHQDRICNASILLFGKQPQRFFINSEVRCAHFHGTEVAKPIPSYQVYKGDVFQLVDQAVDFVLSKVDFIVGTRKESTQVPGRYEIPKEVVAEAIVNAVVHRDYTSNGSVQVMLFRDRLEIWNPGSLPLGWSTAKLREPHPSIPANPFLAEPMYLTGYIERLGTGTPDMIRIASEAGLREPQFIQEDIFKVIIWRKETFTGQASGEVTVEATGEDGAENHQQVIGQVTGQVTGQVEYLRRVILVIKGECKRSEIQEALGLRHRETFMENYLNPAIEKGYVEMTVPDAPTSPKQRYRLTKKGLKFKKKLQSNE